MHLTFRQLELLTSSEVICHFYSWRTTVEKKNTLNIVNLRLFCFHCAVITFSLTSTFLRVTTVLRPWYEYYSCLTIQFRIRRSQDDLQRYRIPLTSLHVFIDFNSWFVNFHTFLFKFRNATLDAN